MTEIYYVQNEKQYRQLLVRLAIEKDKDPDELYDIGIYGCNYNLDEDGDCYWGCCEDGCDSDVCGFISHRKDKDITDHITVKEVEVDFPLIFVLADAYFHNERVTMVSVKEAKENTKYGHHYNDCWGRINE